VIGMTLGAFAGLLGLLARRYWERRVYTGTAVMVMVALQYGKCEDVLYRYPALLISLIPLLWLVNWFSGAGAAVRSSMQGPSVPIMVRHSPPLQSSRANRSVRHSAERPSHPA
jgi:hypothetical protein